MKKRLCIVAIAFGIIAGLAIVGSVYHKLKSPYGWSHCCIIGVMGAL